MFSDNFIDTLIKRSHSHAIVTRFPPEPSGYLHLGHIKSIALNFSMASKYGGVCNLRFDDTNPCTSNKHFTEQIIKDIHWLGYIPHQILYTSDYFSIFYDYALHLIKTGKAYVCDLSAKEMQQYRGTLMHGGTNSTYRDRSVAKNLQLFKEMKSGVHPEGSRTLRAHIDMNSGNINMRDPVLFRIKTHCSHYRYGNTWSIYPSYIFSHVLSDMTEGVTHSLCTLEFEDQRPLYEWILEQCKVSHYPIQIEFSRLNVTGMITSKRAINKLIEETVDMHDPGDPRLDTIAGLRNRGYHPQGLIEFCYQTGVSKQNSCIPRSELERHQRLFLENTAPRRFVILNPLLVEIQDQQSTTLQIPNHTTTDLGARPVYISSEVYIESSDFTLILGNNERKLSPNRAVILMGYGLVSCYNYDVNDNQIVSKVYVRRVSENEMKYDATISWVDVRTAYKLQLTEIQEGCYVNHDALAEQCVSQDEHDQYYQAYRIGYMKRQNISKLIVRLRQGR
jgi:glutaminyl-tRNA synthetase